MKCVRRQTFSKSISAFHTFNLRDFPTFGKNKMIGFWSSATRPRSFLSDCSVFLKDVGIFLLFINLLLLRLKLLFHLEHYSLTDFPLVHSTS